jgi:hypothetical protein
VAADALSRWHEVDVAVHTLSIPNFALLDEFRVEADSLPEVIAKRAELADSTAGPDWALVDDLVVRRDRIFLPASTSVWPMVLEHAHGMGHEGRAEEAASTTHLLHAGRQPPGSRLHPQLRGVPAQQDRTPSSGRPLATIGSTNRRMAQHCA